VKLHWDKINATNLQKGKTYRVSLTNKCLGTQWRDLSRLEESDGVMLRTWRPRAKEEEERADPELKDIDRERRKNYGHGPVAVGENPDMLAIVVESKHIEFQII
jgi:hypothetical protein